MNDDKHVFALYVDSLDELRATDNKLIIKDKDVLFRIGNVLRARTGDSIVLFDAKQQEQGVIEAISAKSCCVKECVGTVVKPLSPHIMWYLPLLDREAFEEALIALTVMGAQEIYPVITRKSRQTWGTPKDRERAKRIMIAAAEQSKQFCLPIIHETITIQDISTTSPTLFFDFQGKPAYEVITQLKKEMPKKLSCIIGPEGDLTQDEKGLLRQKGAVVVALTPTILRASTAVSVGVGLLRSTL